MGFVFEYNVPLEGLEPAILSPFDTCISELQGVHHVQRYVMERLFWPNPELVGSVNAEEPWAVALRNALSSAVTNAIAPLVKYLTTFDTWRDFLNLDVDNYLKSLTHACESEDDEPEEGQPHLVKVDLSSLVSKLKWHAEKRKEVHEAIPVASIECGMVSIERHSSMRGRQFTTNVTLNGATVITLVEILSRYATALMAK